MNNTYEVLVLDLDSTYRDRTQYPNPGQFSAYIAQPNTSSFNSTDPIIAAVPFEAGLSANNAPDANHIYLAVTSSAQDNYYIGDVVEWNGQFSTVQAYTGATHLSTVSPAYSGAPLAADPFQVRQGIPLFISALAAGSTRTALVFSAVPSFYNILPGSYIRITSGPNSGSISLIQSFNPTTATAVIGTALASAPGAGVTFEVLAYTRDNFSPIQLNGSVTGLANPIAYEVQLIELTIPKATLYAANGGTILQYPYVYVELRPKSLPNQNAIFSNNPTATRALFKAMIDTDSLNTNFATMSSCVAMKQFVNFKLTDQFLFTVYMPDGDVISFGEDEMSPFPPNPLIQISATFLLQFPYKESKAKIGK